MPPTSARCVRIRGHRVGDLCLSATQAGRWPGSRAVRKGEGVTRSLVRRGLPGGIRALVVGLWMHGHRGGRRGWSTREGMKTMAIVLEHGPPHSRHEEPRSIDIVNHPRRRARHPRGRRLASAIVLESWKAKGARHETLESPSETRARDSLSRAAFSPGLVA